MKQIRIILVEDEAIVAMQIRGAVQNMGHVVIGTFASGEEVIAALDSFASVDMILMDIKLQGTLDGIETARIIHHRYDIPVVFLTANSELPTVDRANTTAPYGYLLKPVGTHELAICIQITITKFEQDRKVRAMENRLSSLLASTGDAVIATDSNGCITFMNPRAEEYTGFTKRDAENRSVDTVLTIRTADGTALCFEPPAALDDSFGIPLSLDGCTAISRKGREIPIDGSRHPMQNSRDGIVGFAITFRDTTERLTRDKLLQQLEKSESLTRMAAAIAHNYNNLLGGVLGNLELVKMKFGEGLDPGNNLAAAIRISEAAAQLSRQMLTYVGQSFSERTTLDIVALYEKALSDFRRGLPETVTFSSSTTDSSPKICGNGQQIILLLSNILANAYESLPKKCGTISERILVRDAAAIPHAHRFPPEWEAAMPHYACIEIQDTGVGIPADTIDKIFDPFFSTKFMGRGMGLATALGVVREYNGAITVESAEGAGSTFSIYLPLTENDTT